jgi:hypothetical protein
VSTHQPIEPTPNPLDELHRQFVEEDNGGASSSDITQMLDDFLTERGYPTVIYRSRQERSGL